MKALHDIKGNLNGVQIEVTTIKHIMFPEWLSLALNDKKIPAIKALRKSIGNKEGTNDAILSLYVAKKIIESIAGEITSHDSVG